MSFGAMAGWQALLLIAAAGAVAAWLFLLKIRPPRVNVPSLLFWRRVLDQKRDETWWERFRRAVSLAATILIAVALAMAVTRPGPRAAGSTRGRLLLVLDSSWSMLAETTSGGTRWDRAVREARALAASAGGDEVALATTADGLVEGPTSDLALIETAIERLSPSGGATAPWPRVGGADTVHFVTDGAHFRTLDRSVVVHSVYEPAENVAITAFDARPVPSGGTPAAEMTNQVPAEVKRHRVRELAAVESELRDNYYCGLFGRRLQVLVESNDTGTACRYATVELPPNTGREGQFVDVVAGTIRGDRIVAA